MFGLEVGLVHAGDEFFEADLRRPAELLASLGGVAQQQVHFRRTVEARVVVDEGFPVVVAGDPERDFEELANGVGLAGRDHVVIGLVLLQHQPHRLDVVARVTPVTRGVEVAETDRVLDPQLDARQ